MKELDSKFSFRLSKTDRDRLDDFALSVALAPSEAVRMIIENFLGTDGSRQDGRHHSQNNPISTHLNRRLKKPEAKKELPMTENILIDEAAEYMERYALMETEIVEDRRMIEVVQAFQIQHPDLAVREAAGQLLASMSSSQSRRGHQASH